MIQLRMDRWGDVARWDQRIARARALGVEHASAREALGFYAGLAEYQRSLFIDAAEAGAADFVDAVDVGAGAAAMPGFLTWLEQTAPPALRLAAADLRGEGIDWRVVMRDCLMHGDTARRDDGDADSTGRVREDGSAMTGEALAFVVEAVLQPYAEAAALDWMRARAHDTDRWHGLTPLCPVCACAPSVAALREEGHGARRTLVCGRCMTDWEYRRVVCPTCSEERFDSLPVYTADAWPHVRIDACDTCRTYVKTIDLTKNGLAVPLVDDIASVALDLWALDRGYHRARPNLLRTSVPIGRLRVPAIIRNDDR